MDETATFRYGDVFPADDPVSTWLLAICAAVDDAARAAHCFVGALTAHPEATDLRDTAEALYHLRLAVAHTTEGLSHLFLTAKDNKKNDIYSAIDRLIIGKWVGEHSDLSRVRGDLNASRSAVQQTGAALRHATFHVLAQYYPEILDQLAADEFAVPQSETVSPSQRPFITMVAIPQLCASHRKARELDSQGMVSSCPEQWLRDVAKPVTDLLGKFQEFAVRAVGIRCSRLGVAGRGGCSPKG